MKRYSPFASALSAAISELTSDQATRYYSIRAQQDIQTTLDLVLGFACFAYAFGQQCRQWMNAEQPSECLAIALPEAKEIVLVSDSSIVQTAIKPVTVTVLSVTTVQTRALPTYQPIALLPAASRAATTRVSDSVNRLNMTVKELRAMAKQKGVRGYSKMSKATILSLLAA
jgi:hypothetical protein